ncbi:MAG: TIGR03621 family F420-dependent LLM class oxidoreductase [Acidimicrobiia bacterium]
MGEQTFRFGYQLRSRTAEQMLASAVAAEAAYFDVIHTFDHIGDEWPPLAPLMAAAAVTERMRLCPLVVNNDFRHPVHLAREVAALDQLTGGRMELGLGAGHSFTEYEAIGIPFDAPAVRKARMCEAVEILRRLLDGETVSFSGEHYQVREVRTMRALQQHLPIMVGVNGRRPLSHAARHADTIGLTMLGRTLADGQRHETRWEPGRVDQTVAFINEEADGRARPLELHALVQAVIVNDDREAAAANVVRNGWTATVEDALETPFLAIGTHSEIADHLRRCRARWGLSYFSVRDIEAFAPVIEQLRNGSHATP